MKTEFVIVDIDGTVADLRHRLHFIKAVGITPENTVVFEDRSGVVYMWRTLGFTCFQVADGDY